MSDPQSRHVVIKNRFPPLLHQIPAVAFTLGDLAFDHDQRSTI